MAKIHLRQQLFVACQGMEQLGVVEPAHDGLDADDTPLRRHLQYHIALVNDQHKTSCGINFIPLLILGRQAHWFVDRGFLAVGPGIGD